MIGNCYEVGDHRMKTDVSDDFKCLKKAGSFSATAKVVDVHWLSNKTIDEICGG